MKIIIFSILFTVQALSSKDGLPSNDNNSSIMSNISLVTQTINDIDGTNFREMLNYSLTSQFDNDFSTITPEIILFDTTFNNQTWSLSSFSPMDQFDYTTSSDANKIEEQDQWLSVNQSHRRDPYKSYLLWKRTSSLGKSATYVLTSKPECIRQICSVELKYNGTLSSSLSGCLSFFVRTRGQPMGQLWIIEDHNQYNTSQKIQITNKTLRIEHSLKSKLKNLSIEARILFRNSHLDSLILSNLNIEWKGSCPKRHSNSTPSPDIISRRSTLANTFITLTSDESNTLITDDEYFYDQQSMSYESTTSRFSQNTNKKFSFSLLNSRNVRWFLSVISLFCCLIVLCAIGHGMWLIRRRHHFTWNVNFDGKIQLVARRSIRSSARSETNIATVSQISYDILSDNLQKQRIESPTTNSSRSTPISYYTYL